MGCLNMPELPIPTLGGGLSIDVTLPGASFDAALCCKIISLPNFIPPVDIGAAIVPGVGITLAAQIKIIQAYIDALPPKCPKE